jgi:hypothetical protein
MLPIFLSVWSSSSIRSLILSRYCSHVSPSCHGRSQATHAFAPHVLHVHMSGTPGAWPGLLSFDQTRFSRCLSFDSSFPGRWTWPARHLGERHHLQPGVLSQMCLRSSSSYLQVMKTLARLTVEKNWMGDCQRTLQKSSCPRLSRR